VGGVRPLEIRVPVGTHTGWNIRSTQTRGPNLCALDGSFIPFARTREERLAAADPRSSLQERYGSHDGYDEAVLDAARDLVAERFLLEEDAARYVKDAESADVFAGTR
jgi:hypothetical protein